MVPQWQAAIHWHARCTDAPVKRVQSTWHSFANRWVGHAGLNIDYTDSATVTNAVTDADNDYPAGRWPVPFQPCKQLGPCSRDETGRR